MELLRAVNGKTLQVLLRCLRYIIKESVVIGTTNKGWATCPRVRKPALNTMKGK